MGINVCVDLAPGFPDNQSGRSELATGQFVHQKKTQRIHGSKECRGQKASEGQPRDKVLAEFFAMHRGRLRLMVNLRLHERLRPRVDPSDVLQEAFLEASQKLERYLEEPGVPLFLWLRRMTADALHDIHRRHLDAKARDVRREKSLGGGSDPHVTSEAMALLFVSGTTTPSEAAVRQEAKSRVQDALDRLNTGDREVLALRVFEQLTSAESARVLDISRDATKKRYLRALACALQECLWRCVDNGRKLE